MKAETRSFYEEAVHRAVEWIVTHLDEALDLPELARLAALSPFHFHRVFRGMVGETPLELHRRLRMERAAARLLEETSAVTSIAFDAGYETHEAFTRAFRALYGTSPTAFRALAGPAASACARPPQTELAAVSGLHFRAHFVPTSQLSITRGGDTMNVTIREMPALRLATVHHVGPYGRISEAFQKLGAQAAQAGLLRPPTSQRDTAVPIGMGIGVFHDDPETTPPEELHSDAGVVVSKDATLPSSLNELEIEGGRYASIKHVGPYTELGDVWTRFMGQWLPQSGHRVGPGTTYEIYLNSPMEVPPEKLETELFLPIE